jgi:hypothetical protein
MATGRNRGADMLALLGRSSRDVKADTLASNHPPCQAGQGSGHYRRHKKRENENKNGLKINSLYVIDLNGYFLSI